MSVIQPVYYDVDKMEMNGIKQADLHKAIYDLWKAVVAICVKGDTGMASGSQWMIMIGSGLNSAMLKFQDPQSGKTHTGVTP
jgi:hypothetical protein